MKVLSGLFLGLAIVLATVFGPQTEAWSWGPACVALALSIFAGLFNRSPECSAWGIWLTISLAVGWVLLRAAQSPVTELARADGMLALCFAGGAWAAAGIAPYKAARSLFFVILALVVLSNVSMAFIQIGDPSIVWPYAAKPSAEPTGFFGHYNYFSNFIVGAGLLLMGWAVFSRDAVWPRALSAIAFLGSAVAVPLSGSRGGMLALSIGVLVILVAIGVVLWRRKSSLAPAFSVAVPILMTITAAVGWSEIKEIQAQRLNVDTPLSIVDGQDRLAWLELALDVASDHLAVGGGSRSYWWERAAKWDPKEYGPGYENEPFVHNEIVQVLTDYGSVGVLLVLMAVGAVTWRGIHAIFLEGREADKMDERDAIVVGALAGGAAMLVQSNLSFVFHLLPSTMLLGCLFGLVAGTGPARSRPQRAPILRWASGVVMVAVLGYLGLKATRVLERVWPVLYAKESLAREAPAAAIERLREAHLGWPGFKLKEREAFVAQAAAGRPGLTEAEQDNWLTVARGAYREAAKEHPFHAGLVLNQANLLSAQNHAIEAREMYELAIALQGGLETAFNARLNYARHLYDFWSKEWTQNRRAGEALAGFYIARELLAGSDGATYRGRWLEVVDFKKQIDAVIEFLENAGIEPKSAPE